MSDEQRLQIERYVESLFVEPDPALAQGLVRADAAGLPAIQVAPNQGKLLYLLTKISGAHRVLEIGTLGGYSTTWLARALPDGGVVTTLELNQAHADVARINLDRAGVGERVTIEVGPAAETLRRLVEQRIAPFDLIFIDADKPGYSTYLDFALQLSRPGTVILADNLIRNGAVLNETPVDENARAARAFNAKLAAHPRLESIIVPALGKSVDGMSISIVGR
ncbi:MAG TPA: O-methyltransferase [Vicinamibacterales bacterium]|nr:O-methyltransferase [Vicinamibacterales bacterium]